MAIYIYDGVSSDGIILNSLDLFVYKGGEATDTTLNSDGKMYVNSGGTANVAMLNSGGKMYVYTGGTANEATVNDGGFLDVSSGGTASGIVVSSGATAHFAVAPDTYVQWTHGDSSYEIKDAVISDYTVSSNIWLYVTNGGTAENPNVLASNAVIWVSNGGKVNCATLSDKGYITINSGGTAENTIVNLEGSVHINSGGNASETTVNTGGRVYVDKGVASATTLNSGGKMYVYTGGTANEATVNDGGFLDVSSGGTASGIVVSSGATAHFAVAPDTYVQWTQGDSSFEMKDAQLFTATVAGGVRMDVSSGGSVTNTQVNSGGALWVFCSALADHATVNESGSITLSSGGSAMRCELNSGGVMWVNKGAYISSTGIFAGGKLYVSGTGIASDTNIASGNMYVYSGGTAVDTTVTNGKLVVSFGATLTGMTRVGDEAIVSMYEGSTLDFDLALFAERDEPIVENLTLIKGTPTYTITVSDSQEKDLYKLADGATGFNGTFTVQSNAHEEYGTLTLGESLTIGNDEYTLNLNNGELTLVITSPTNTSPTITNDDGDVLLANTMPQAEYMYGCCPTATAMLLGYYDLYGYRGKDLSNLIEGDVELNARGTDGDIYNMNAFDTVLGNATATEDYVYRFVSREDIGTIVEDIYAVLPTTPEEELEYSFVNNGEGPEIRTDVWNCLADYLGTGQFWRGNADLSTGYQDAMLEETINDDDMQMIAYGMTERTIATRLSNFQYGLYLYAQDKGYALDMKVTGTHKVDVIGGDFTFNDYMKEIDAGRPVLVIINEHIMTGYGYNVETQEIIFDDCYEADQRMVWNGVYNYADEDRHLESIATIGFMTTDADIDLAVMAIDGASDKTIISTTEDALVSEDYVFYGSPLYMSFGAANLGTSDSGSFDAYIYIDGEQTIFLPSISVAAETVTNLRNIPVPGEVELAPGLHSITVYLDPDNKIQELKALNNIDERTLMVLKEGTNVVQDFKQVASGEVSSDDYVMDGAGLQVLDGGIAEGTLVQGKVTDVAPNGVVSFFPGIVTAELGGLVRDTVVYEYGQLQVSGMAEDISVNENGFAVVFDGGVISGISVAESATLTVEAGGVLTGQIQLAQDADVTFEDGAVLDFDLTQTAAGGDALVSDLSIIQGTPSFTLTVSDTPNGGLYALADGAAEFDGTLSVLDSNGAELGELTVGETLSLDNAEYTLNLADNLLSVKVVVTDVEVTNLVGTPEKVSWEANGAAQFIVEYSMDNFEHVIQVVTTATATDLLELPAGTYQWRVKAGEDGEWTVGDAFSFEAEASAPKVVRSNEDGNDDIFFAMPSDTWDNNFCAHHVGSINDWTGTDETVPLAGKGRFQNLFFGSEDPNVLCLTDAENGEAKDGDALFVDDIYTELPEEVEEQTARLLRIQEIRAGAGNDVVDMTSQDFEYLGEGLTIRGGEGNDVIWANKGDNLLFGDKGNDRLVGASGNDILVGGEGDDKMHGGGGNDIFAFGGDWGNDTVEQLADGKVTLWFKEGVEIETVLNADAITYTDGNNSVTVEGVAQENITLKFGNEDARYADLLAAGAFSEYTSQRIFEDKGMLA